MSNLLNTEFIHGHIHDRSGKKMYQIRSNEARAKMTKKAVFSELESTK